MTIYMEIDHTYREEQNDRSQVLTIRSLGQWNKLFSYRAEGNDRSQMHNLLLSG